MKKLLIAAMAVCAAAFANAASVEWSTGTVYGAGEGGNGYNMDTYIDAASGFVAQLFVSATYDSTTDSLGDLVSFTSGDTATDFSEGYAYNSALSVADGDKTWYGKVIVTDLATGATLSSEIFSFEVSTTAGYGEPYVGDGGMSIALANGGELDATLGAWSTSGWQAAAVPEPTSGLLLLLGVAGLALKRKRA